MTKDCKIFKSTITKMLKSINSCKKSRKTRRSCKPYRKPKRKSNCKPCRKPGRKSRCRFGQMPGTYSIMSNTPPSDMSIFQQYTGMSPNQMKTHLENIPASLRDNFYSSQPLDYVGN